MGWGDGLFGLSGERQEKGAWIRLEVQAEKGGLDGAEREEKKLRAYTDTHCLMAISCRPGG